MKSKKYSFTAWQVKLKIEGFNIHRLLSEMMRRRIEMRDIKYVSETEMEMATSITDYYRIKKLVGKKYRIEILNETGYIPLIKKLKLRKATMIGLAFFFILLYYQSLFVSEIRIYGYEHFTESEIRQVLEEAGFHEGARKLRTKDEMNKVKLHMFNRLDRLSWVGITYDGTLAEVTIVEGNDWKEVTDTSVPCDVVADKSGYIASISVTQGIMMVDEGTYVSPGDVLISGVMPLNSTAYGMPGSEITERYVHADGDVEIYVPHHFKFQIRDGILDENAEKSIITAVREKNESDEEFVKRIADKEIRRYMKENVSETAVLTNKGLNFEVKENIIEVYVLLETLEKIGIKQEIMNGSEQSV